MPNEVTGTDQHVRDLVRAISPTSTLWEQGDGTPDLIAALRGGSKGVGGGIGKPEFMFYSNHHLVIIEDKRRHEDLIFLDDSGDVDCAYPARQQYATNGAVHYARHILDNLGRVKGIFAIGAVGDSTHFQTDVRYVTRSAIKALPFTTDFSEFAPGEIDEFYRVSVLGELPREERSLQAVKRIASRVHEDMRNYGSLEGERKATTVSAILLALKNPDFNVSHLRGSTVAEQNDGQKIYNAASGYLDSQYVGAEGGNQRRGAIKDEFSFLRSSVTLNSPRSDLGGKTPLRVFAETLGSEVLDYVSSTSSFDILGNFYGEFVKYGGSDGNSLGIVLTPHHITTLMADLIDVGRDDYVLDPCAGTAAFLVAAMRRMIERSDGSDEALDDIRSHRLHGVELQEKLYAIGATNMILRGDGKANFRRNDIFHIDDAELRTSIVNGVEVEHGFTKSLMNPPYSQGKSESTRTLSELHFVIRALDLLNQDALLAAIVPASVMTNAKKNLGTKNELLSRHTLEAVITMNTQTFYGVGTNPVIAIFRAGAPHPDDKRVSFIDYRDDGMTVRPHVGLVGDGTQESKRRHLLRVFRGNEDEGSHFIVKSQIRAEDEWLHAFYYFNDEPPSLADLEGKMGDFIAFQLDMMLHNRGYLFEGSEDANDRT
ncbi:class I SAM-dependent DNA methyltransferase [Brachybacterium vulturis]|uniref:HsdM family class I SAM-dependent methyltransferase n=1 Tax=Brachybacterium vulturis TaxID=2017484 RepID=UPI003734D549